MAIQRITRADWASGAGWNGKLEGKDIETNLSFLFNEVQGDGLGPPRHSHPYDEVYLVREGQALVEVGDETCAVSAGDIVLIPAGSPHKVTTLGDDKTEIISIHLSAHLQMTMTE